MTDRKPPGRTANPPSARPDTASKTSASTPSSQSVAPSTAKSELDPTGSVEGRGHADTLRYGPRISAWLKGWEGLFNFVVMCAVVLGTLTSYCQWRVIDRANDIALETRRAKLGAEIKVNGFVPYELSRRTPPPGGRTIQADMPINVSLILTNRGQQPARDVTLLNACVTALTAEPADIPCTGWKVRPAIDVEPTTTHEEILSAHADGKYVEDVWDGKLTPFVFAVVRYDDGNGKHWIVERCLQVGTQIQPWEPGDKSTQPCRRHNSERPEPSQK